MREQPMRKLGTRVAQSLPEAGEARGRWVGNSSVSQALFLLLFLSQGYELSKIGMLLMLLIFPLLSDMSLFAASKSWVYKDFYFKKVPYWEKIADRERHRRRGAGR